MAIQTKGKRKQKKKIVHILVLALMMVFSTSVFSFAAGLYPPAERDTADRVNHAFEAGRTYCAFSNEIKVSRSEVIAMLNDVRGVAKCIEEASGLSFYKSNCKTHDAMSAEEVNKEPNVHVELIDSNRGTVGAEDLQPLLDDTNYVQDPSTGDLCYSVYFDVKIEENGKPFFTNGNSTSKTVVADDQPNLIKVTVTVPASTYHVVTVHKEEQSLEVTTLYEGEEYELPTVEKEGFELVGWFSDAELTVPFDPATVTADVDIYPKWEEKAVAPPATGQSGGKKEDPKAAAVSSGDKSGAEVAGEEEVALMDGGGDMGEAPKIKVKGNVISKTMDKGLLNFSVPTVNIPFKGGSVGTVERKEEIDVLGLALVVGAGLAGLLFALTIASDMRVIRWFNRRKAQLQ